MSPCLELSSLQGIRYFFSYRHSVTSQSSLLHVYPLYVYSSYVILYSELSPCYNRFDWSGKISLLKERSNVLEVISSDDGVADVVFMWWDLVMDVNGTVILSCAPTWAHPMTVSQNVLPWRDHWMQGVYYLPDVVSVQKEEKLVLVGHHDEYSFWFHLFNKKFW